MNKKVDYCTPFSEKPYYPYLLSNGNDTVLVNYSGTMLCGVTGHMHTEQHQNSVLAWYKQEHRRKDSAIGPVIISGYLVIVDGEVCEPSDFTQHFVPRRAELESCVSFRCGVKLQIVTYLTDTGVLAYEFEVLESKAENMSIVFMLLAPHSFEGTGIFKVPAPIINFVPSDNRIDYTFTAEKSKVSGKGALLCDRTDGTNCDSWFGAAPGIRFDNVGAGWTGKMYTLCVDEQYELPEVTADLREKHQEGWAKYFSTSDICVPDEKHQHYYELSRYIIKAAQHKSGGIVCGFLPHMWDGGICCPCDAHFSCLAFLQSNNVAEARKHLQFYLDQYDAGVELVKNYGLSGTAFSNWSNVFGTHCHHDLGRDLMKRKPIMIAIIGIAAGEYCLYVSPDDAEVKKLLHGCADFIESGFIRDGEIASTIAGNESILEVNRDTLMLSVTIRVLELDAKFNAQPHRMEIAKQMREQLELNRDADGILLPWENARYYSGIQTTSQHYLRGIHSAEQLTKFSERTRTSWGNDCDQPNEVYRDWSWSSPLYAREFLREGNAKKAFEWISSFGRYASSTGALPEKIRLDGYAIGYWYQSVYALYLEAFCELFGCMKDDTLYLLPGLDGTWKDFSVENLRLENGILLSMKVSGGVVEELQISGDKAVKTVLNSAYSFKKS